MPTVLHTRCTARRVGPVMGQTTPASTLVTAGLAHPDGPLFGLKLDRAAVLQHPRLNEFWKVSDFILEKDPLARGHLLRALSTAAAGL